ncbi:MAG: integrase [Chloroflexi bacterium]|nr:integrase [Chloroflexota bacterium]
MKTYITTEEIELLENAATCLRDKLLIRLLARLGCRISEALALDVKSIDFIRCTVTIQHLKSRIHLACLNCNVRLAKSDIFCPKCGNKIGEALAKEKQHCRMRMLPIDDGTLKMLRIYINKCSDTVTTDDKQLIFGFNRHRAWQIITECAKRANLPELINPETGRVHNISPHRLRDAFAVHAVQIDDSGDGLRLLQEHLGHQSITTTMRYRKISGEEQQKWFAKLWDNRKRKRKK